MFWVNSLNFTLFCLHTSAELLNYTMTGAHSCTVQIDWEITDYRQYTMPSKFLRICRFTKAMSEYLANSGVQALNADCWVKIWGRDGT